MLLFGQHPAFSFPLCQVLYPAGSTDGHPILNGKTELCRNERRSRI